MGTGFLFLISRTMKKSKNLLNEEVTLENVIKSIKKSEPIIWEKDKEELVDFYQIAKVLELNHIIYVSDPSGILNSIWAMSEYSITDFLEEFSIMGFFIKVYKIDDAIENGFIDGYQKQNEFYFNLKSKSHV